MDTNPKSPELQEELGETLQIVPEENKEEEEDLEKAVKEYYIRKELLKNWNLNES